MHVYKILILGYFSCFDREMKKRKHIKSHKFNFRCYLKKPQNTEPTTSIIEKFFKLLKIHKKIQKRLDLFNVEQFRSKKLTGEEKLLRVINCLQKKV